MNVIIIGNVLGFIGSLLMVGIGFIHNKNYILIGQIVQFIIMGLGNLVLGGVSGFVSDIVGVLRNLYFLKQKSSKRAIIFFLALQIIVASVFMVLLGFKWRELLPIFATGLFTLKIDTKKESELKIILNICQIMWLIYDIVIMNYATAVFDILTLCSNFVGMMRALKKEKMSA